MMQSDESDEVALDTEKDEGIGRKNSEDLKDNSSVRLKLLNHWLFDCYYHWSRRDEKIEAVDFVDDASVDSVDVELKPKKSQLLQRSLAVQGTWSRFTVIKTHIKTHVKTLCNTLTDDQKQRVGVEMGKNSREDSKSSRKSLSEKTLSGTWLEALFRD